MFRLKRLIILLVLIVLIAPSIIFAQPGAMTTCYGRGAHASLTISCTTATEDCGYEADDKPKCVPKAANPAPPNPNPNNNSTGATGGNFIPNSCELKRDFSGTQLKCALVDGVCPLDGTGESADCGMCCFVQKVDNITNWVFYVMTAIAVLLFIYGGLTYMTALGDPDKAGKGKQIIIYAMLGLIIALISKVVPAIVTTLVK